MNMKINKVLIVVAHPDDDILGCGGLIDKLIREKKIIKIIFLAEGSSCRFLKKNQQKKIVNAIKERTKCAIEALSYLNVKRYKFYDLECGRLDQYPKIEINKIIEKEIVNFNPDTILTHNKNDCNLDHCIVYHSVIAASRPKPNCVVKNILSFEVLSSTEWNFDKSFSPNYFVNIEKNIMKKIEAFKKYYITEGGNFPFPRSEEGILTLSKYRGMQVGFKNAEAYKIIRSVIN